MKQMLSRLFVLMALVLLPITAHAKSPEEGRWNTPKNQGTIEVSVNGGTLSGKLVEASNEKAPIGLKILRGFKKEGDVWVGKLYSPKRGRTFDATLERQGDKLVITVSAMGRSKTIKWTKAG